MLAACALLRRSTGRIVKPVLEKMFTLWPTPVAFMNASLADIVQVIRPAGLQNTKYVALVNIIQVFAVDMRPLLTYRIIEQWREVGVYSAQSWLMFIERLHPSNYYDRIADHVLQDFLDSHLWPRFVQLGHIENPLITLRGGCDT